MTTYGSSDPPTASCDVLVVGAGFAGLYAVYKLRDQGLHAIGVEAAPSVGGTWFWNRYPGAQCDAESNFYSYSFSEKLRSSWTWSRRFAPQAEILAYLNHAADQLDVRDAFHLGQRVTTMHYRESDERWTVITDGGLVFDARYAVMATGCLSDAQRPDIPGCESFQGEIHQAAYWPDTTVDLQGRHVGVVGTGSSAVQLIPVVARSATALTVFQRTPNYVVPAGNRPLSPKENGEIAARYADLAERARWSTGGLPQESGGSVFDVDADERNRIFREAWDRGGIFDFISCFSDTRTSLEANEIAAQFIRDQIRAAVHDPQTARILSPAYPFGAKRPVAGTDYYETYNRSNVRLVDISGSGIQTVTERGVVVEGRHWEVDVLILATGFDAFTGALFKIDIVGRAGTTLRAHWASGPRTLLGIGTSRFPNFFVLTGPGSPSVLGNVVVSIEQHVDWLAGLLRYTREHGETSVEVTAEAEARWTAHVNDMGAQTMIGRAGNSWYVGANIPGKPRSFLPYAGGVGRFREICDHEAASRYPGFRFGGRRRSGAVSVSPGPLRVTP